MASSKPICDPCLRKELPPSLAIKYCTDCEENICLDCWNAHNLFKALSSHHVIDSGSLPVEIISVNNVCTKHEKMVLDFFCVEHDCLCCRSCIASTHRTCQEIVPLGVAAKGVRKSYMLEDTFSTVSNIRGILNRLSSNRDENLKRLNDEEADVLKNLSLIKSKILERINDIERKVICEIKSSKIYCINRIESEKNTLAKMMESLEEFTSTLDFVSQHGSENQLFILLNSYKWRVSDFDFKIQKMIASMLTCKISFKPPSQPQPEIISFGSVHIESASCPIVYKTSKSKQAQVLLTTIQRPIKFECNFKFDIKYTNCVSISSIAVTDDNRLLLCNHYSKELVAYSDRGEFIQDCTLSGNPWGIAIIPGEDKAVVSLPYASSIQFIDIKSMKCVGTHSDSILSDCYGIAVVGDKICVGSIVGTIYILTKQGKKTAIIHVPNVSCIEYLHPGPQDSVYYTVYNNNKVGCVYLGREKCVTWTRDIFQGPDAVTTDREGYLYVACRESNNIHRLSPDGKVIDIILDHDKKISGPYGLAFSKNYRYLFVTNDNGKSVFLFSCS